MKFLSLTTLFIGLTILPSAFADSAKLQIKFTMTMRESFKETSDHSWISTYEKTTVKGFQRIWQDGELTIDKPLDKVTEGASTTGKEISLEIVGANIQRKTGNGPVKQVPVKVSADSLKIKKGEIDGLFGISSGIKLNCTSTGRVSQYKNVKASAFTCTRQNSMMDCEVTISADAGCSARN